MPEPAPFTTRACFTVLGLLLVLVLCPLSRAQEGTGEAAGEGAGRDVLLVRSVTRILLGTHPRVKPDEMLSYYSRTSPDVFDEIRAQVESGAADPGPYLRRLADHFEKMENVRRRDPAEFARLVALEQLETRARMLGQRIQQLAAMLAEAPPDNAATVRVALAAAKEELRSVLERAFDTSQQNQRVEVNRLEAELRAMRGLLDERDLKRDLILQQRFLLLSGQELPPPPEPLAKGTPEQ